MAKRSTRLEALNITLQETGIGFKKEISHKIEHIFTFLDDTRDGAAVHNSL